MTRIAYLGNFRHPWCTEVHISRDAERLNGVTVDRIQEPSALPGPQWPRWLRRLEERAGRAELLLYQRTWGMPPAAIETFRRLEEHGTMTASYHLDLYHGLKREATVEGDPFWQTGVVFTADGDPETQAWLAGLGIDHRWLPAAIVSDECVELEPAAPPDVDVVFVGSAPAHYHPEWPWRAELVDGLRAYYGRRFALLPSGPTPIRGEQLSRLYAGVPVVVGDSLSPPGHRNYWSDRYYETVGRGGFLVGPDVPGIEQHFTDQEHLRLYRIGEIDDVIDLVNFALGEGPRYRKGISRAGMVHVRDEHTYRHRVETMLMSLGLR